MLINKKKTKCNWALAFEMQDFTLFKQQTMVYLLVQGNCPNCLHIWFTSMGKHACCFFAHPITFISDFVNSVTHVVVFHYILTCRLILDFYSNCLLLILLFCTSSLVCFCCIFVFTGQ